MVDATFVNVNLNSAFAAAGLNQLYGQTSTSATAIQQKMVTTALASSKGLMAQTLQALELRSFMDRQILQLVVSSAPTFSAPTFQSLTGVLHTQRHNRLHRYQPIGRDSKLGSHSQQKPMEAVPSSRSTAINSLKLSDYSVEINLNGAVSADNQALQFNYLDPTGDQLTRGRWRTARNY